MIPSIPGWLARYSLRDNQRMQLFYAFQVIEKQWWCGRNLPFGLAHHGIPGNLGHNPGYASI
jgi:hypothetical protein